MDSPRLARLSVDREVAENERCILHLTDIWRSSPPIASSTYPNAEEADAQDE